MLICPSDVFYSTNVMLLGQVSDFKRCLLLSLSTWLLKKFLNKSAVQTPTTDFINQKEKHVSIRYNSILTLMKSGAPLFGIDLMYMIDLDVKYFLVVCLSIFYEKPAVKTTLTPMKHFSARKSNYCQSGIIGNSVT